MPAETTLGISYETRDDLETIQRALRCANGGRAVSWDETVRELMAAWHELRNMVRDDADT